MQTDDYTIRTDEDLKKMKTFTKRFYIQIQHPDSYRQKITFVCGDFEFDQEFKNLAELSRLLFQMAEEFDRYITGKQEKPLKVSDKKVQVVENVLWVKPFIFTVSFPIQDGNADPIRLNEIFHQFIGKPPMRMKLEWR